MIKKEDVDVGTIDDTIEHLQDLEDRLSPQIHVDRIRLVNIFQHPYQMRHKHLEKLVDKTAICYF